MVNINVDHGSLGQTMFPPNFSDPALDRRHDQAPMI